MKRIMKTVWSSYLHLSNILLNWIEFLNRVIESSFSTRLKFLSSTSQFDSTLFQKNFNSTWHFSSRVLDSNSSTQLDVISLSFKLTFWTWIDIESNCSYFQLDVTRLNWKLSQLDLIHQELKLNVKRVKYKKISGFLLLHYLFDRKSWRRT